MTGVGFTGVGLKLDNPVTGLNGLDRTELMKLTGLNVPGSDDLGKATVSRYRINDLRCWYQTKKPPEAFA